MTSIFQGQVKLSKEPPKLDFHFLLFKDYFRLQYCMVLQDANEQQLHGLRACCFSRQPNAIMQPKATHRINTQLNATFSSSSQV